MTRGRKPTPTRLRVITGNRGRRPFNENEPRPTLALVEPPSYLSALARQEWEYQAPELMGLGLLTPLDRAAFAAYCQAWGDVCEAEAALRQYGRLIRGYRGTPVKSPWVRIRDFALKQMHVWAIEFGLTPSSRTRISIAAPPMPEDHPGDKYLS